MARVKICGLNDAAGFDAAVAAGADWVGFVFFAASPRAVSAAAAAVLSARAPRHPPRVGLFVSPEDAEVAAVLAEVRLDILQVYAPADRVRDIRTRFGLPVWRAVPVAARSDLPDTTPGIDGLVIEAKAPNGSTRPGGNAIRLDGSVLDGWTAPAPWLLAGGLDALNVTAAIAATGAPAVDVSSGVERALGIKDPDRIRAFVHAARTVPKPP